MYPPSRPHIFQSIHYGEVNAYAGQRPLFRVATGLIPSSVWRTSFGVDRAELIGHKLDADKLEAKLPQNLANLDLHLVRISVHSLSITRNLSYEISH